MNSEDRDDLQHNQNNDVAAQKLQSRGSYNASTGSHWNRMRNPSVINGKAMPVNKKNTNNSSESKLTNKNNNPSWQNTGNHANHERPDLGVSSPEVQSKANNPKNGDIGSRNLQTSLANKAKNLWQNRKKNKERGSDNSDSANSDDVTNSESFESESETLSELKARIKRKMIIRLAIIGLGLFALYALIMVVASAVTGGSVFKITPIDSSKKYGTSDFKSITDEDSKSHNDEINYYKKIKEIVDKNDEEVNVNYLSAVLIELFYEYEPDFAYDDEALQERLRDTAGIDFVKMTNNIDIFYNVIKSVHSTDYSVDGPIYVALKNSNEFKNYYSEVLKTKDADDVLNNIFKLGEEMELSDEVDDTVITNETKVTNNNQSMTINSYLTDSIYASTTSIQNSEMVKAYTIAYSTNLASQNNKLTIDSNSAAASNNLCSVKDGCSYNDNNQLVSGPGKKSSKNTVNYNGKYYYRRPLTQDEINNLNKNINSVFGNVLVKDDGTYPVLDIDKINGLGDGYQAILSNSYGSLSYKSIGEDSYILDGSYGTKQVKTQVTFYDQGDYTSYNFCGKKKETIKTSGCGITSMAMIVSTYEKNSKYDPVAMMNEARKTGYCGGSIVGTSPGFFKKEASTMKYKYYKASKSNKKDLNTVLKHLSEGHLVIAHMSPGHFTNGGHYMVLGGVDPGTKKVYVYDPNNKSNSSWRKTGNGWYSFNDIIVKEAWNFYIIWKG